MSALVSRLPLAVALCLVAGCANQSPPERTRYILAVERGAEGEALDAGTLRIGRFRVSPAFEREGFVYRLGEAQWESDLFHVFARPPGALARQGAGEWLDASGIFTAVVGATDSTDVDWMIEGRIQRFYADLRAEPQVVIRASFTLLDSRSTQLDAVFRSGYEATRPAAGSQPAALVEGWSGAWAEILTALEDDLRVFFRARAERASSELDG